MAVTYILFSVINYILHNQEKCILVAPVCVSLATFLHYCTDQNLSLRNGRGCPTVPPIVVHYMADLQSVHGFRCYGIIHA